MIFLGWLMSTVVCLACLYGLMRFEGDTDATSAETGIYVGFTRLAWGIGMAWIVFACIYGYGGK